MVDGDAGGGEHCFLEAEDSDISMGWRTGKELELLQVHKPAVPERTPQSGPR